MTRHLAGALSGGCAEWDVAYHGGTHTIRVGDVWADGLFGGKWRVIEPSGDRIYSPSGLGGTPCFWCAPVGDVHESLLRHQDKRGYVEFCGDSIAASLSRPDKAQATGGS